MMPVQVPQTNRQSGSNQVINNQPGEYVDLNTGMGYSGIPKPNQTPVYLPTPVTYNDHIIHSGGGGGGVSPAPKPTPTPSGPSTNPNQIGNTSTVPKTNDQIVYAYYQAPKGYQSGTFTSTGQFYQDLGAGSKFRPVGNAVEGTLVDTGEGFILTKKEDAGFLVSTKEGVAVGKKPQFNDTGVSRAPAPVTKSDMQTATNVPQEQPKPYYQRLYESVEPLVNPFSKNTGQFYQGLAVLASPFTKSFASAVKLQSDSDIIKSYVLSKLATKDEAQQQQIFKGLISKTPSIVTEKYRQQLINKSEFANDMLGDASTADLIISGATVATIGVGALLGEGAAAGTGTIKYIASSGKYVGAGIGTGFAGYEGVKFFSNPTAKGLGTTFGAGVLAGLSYTPITKEVTKTYDIKPEDFRIQETPQGKSIVVRYGTLTEKPGEFSIPFKQTIYDELSKTGRITFSYPQYELDKALYLNKAFDIINNKIAPRVNTFISDNSIYSGLAPNEYAPKPSYAGQPFSSEVQYGFDSSKTLSFTKEEALKARSDVIENLMKQGYSENQAKQLLQYTAARNYLDLTDVYKGIVQNPKTEIGTINIKGAEGKRYIVPLATESKFVDISGNTYKLSSQGLILEKGLTSQEILKNKDFIGFIKKEYEPYSIISSKAELLDQGMTETLLRNMKLRKENPIAYKELEDIDAMFKEGLTPKKFMEVATETNINTGEVNRVYSIKDLFPTIRKTDISYPIKSNRLAGVKIVSSKDGQVQIAAIKNEGTLDLSNPPAGRFVTTESVIQKASSISDGKLRLTEEASEQLFLSDRNVFTRIIENVKDDGFIEKLTLRYETQGAAQLSNVGEIVGEGNKILTSTKSIFKEAGKAEKPATIYKPSSREILDVDKAIIEGDTKFPSGEYNIKRVGNEIYLSKSGKVGSPFKILDEDLIKLSKGQIDVARSFGGRILMNKEGKPYLVVLKKGKQTPYDLPNLAGGSKKLGPKIESPRSFVADEGGGEEAVESTIMMFNNEQNLGPLSIELKNPQQAFNELRNVQVPVISRANINMNNARAIDRLIGINKADMIAGSKGILSVGPVSTIISTPISTPISVPTSVPVLTPTLTPVLTPILTPVVTPITTPVLTPVVTPILTPVLTPVVTPILTPTVTPVPKIFPGVTPSYNPFPLAFPFEPRKRKIRKINPSYSVLLKRRGKYIPVAAGLPRGRALLAGENAALKSIARTFKLVESGATDVEDVDFNVDERLFRGYQVRRGKAIPTPNIFIQRRNQALATRSERLEINLAKQEKRLRKSMMVY